MVGGHRNRSFNALASRCQTCQPKFRPHRTISSRRPLQHSMTNPFSFAVLSAFRTHRRAGSPPQWNYLRCLSTMLRWSHVNLADSKPPIRQPKSPTCQLRAWLPHLQTAIKSRAIIPTRISPCRRHVRSLDNGAQRHPTSARDSKTNRDAARHGTLLNQRRFVMRWPNLAVSCYKGSNGQVQPRFKIGSYLGRTGQVIALAPLLRGSRNVYERDAAVEYGPEQGIVELYLLSRRELDRPPRRRVVGTTQ